MMHHASRKRRGRPPLSTAGSAMFAVRLPAPLIDQYAQLAHRRGVDVAVVVREALEFRITKIANPGSSAVRS